MMPACDIDGSSLAPPETLPIFNVLIFLATKNRGGSNDFGVIWLKTPVFQNQESNQITLLVADPGEQ